MYTLHRNMTHHTTGATGIRRFRRFTAGRAVHPIVVVAFQASPSAGGNYTDQATTSGSTFAVHTSHAPLNFSCKLRPPSLSGLPAISHGLGLPSARSADYFHSPKPRKSERLFLLHVPSCLLVESEVGLLAHVELGHATRPPPWMLHLLPQLLSPLSPYCRHPNRPRIKACLYKVRMQDLLDAVVDAPQ